MFNYGWGDAFQGFFMIGSTLLLLWGLSALWQALARRVKRFFRHHPPGEEEFGRVWVERQDRLNRYDIDRRPK